MIYSATRLAGRIAFELLLGYHLDGVAHVPRRGKLILVCNHTSYLDPPLVAMALFRRELSFLARDSLFEHRVLGWYLKSLHAFPLKRGQPDLRAWRDLQDRIEREEAVLLFPEGTRSPDGRLQRAQPGVGLLAFRCSSATVLPVRIFGAHAVLSKNEGFQGLRPVAVTFGHAVDLHRERRSKACRQTYQLIADKLMQAIAELAPAGSYSALCSPSDVDASHFTTATSDTRASSDEGSRVA